MSKWSIPSRKKSLGSGPQTGPDPSYKLPPSFSRPCYCPGTGRIGARERAIYSINPGSARPPFIEIRSCLEHETGFDDAAHLFAVESAGTKTETRRDAGGVDNGQVTADEEA